MAHAAIVHTRVSMVAAWATRSSHRPMVRWPTLIPRCPSFQKGSAISKGISGSNGDRKSGRSTARGGKPEYLPEVHWEVYEVIDDSAIEWKVGEYGTQVWTNEKSEIIDPRYLLSANGRPGFRDGVKKITRLMHPSTIASSAVSLIFCRVGLKSNNCQIVRPPGVAKFTPLRAAGMHISCKYATPGRGT
jgi:hypothetical protein